MQDHDLSRPATEGTIRRVVVDVRSGWPRAGTLGRRVLLIVSSPVSAFINLRNYRLRTCEPLLGSFITLSFRFYVQGLG